ncbi:hypothetical protein M231_03439 [Tremella mesenterica]|uniref:Uncharacterized protein n=1 Tax=Tremella mesenterica TaxID=5217 RepID=A0A4Q1BMZ6_TREME|nr:hypothetical protein M231_03439 [Tremella mesenterica]
MIEFSDSTTIPSDCLSDRKSDETPIFHTEEESTDSVRSYLSDRVESLSRLEFRLTADFLRFFRGNSFPIYEPDELEETKGRSSWISQVRWSIPQVNDCPERSELDIYKTIDWAIFTAKKQIREAGEVLGDVDDLEEKIEIAHQEIWSELLASITDGDGSMTEEDEDDKT